MKKIVLFVIAVLGFLPATGVCSEKVTSTEELYFMEIPNVITASKVSEKLSDAPAVVTVITKEEIKKFGANNLHEILNRAPSVYTIGQYLNVDGNTSIRGDLLYGQDLHVLLLLNGRPIRDNTVGGYNLAFYEGFPVELIERIEVIRGPGSVLYGSNAYVGVIDIITKKAEGNSITATTGAGSFGTYLGNVVCEVKKGDLAFSGAVKYLDSAGWTFSAVDENNIRKSPNESKHNVGFDATVDYKNLSLNIYGATIKDMCMGTSQAIWGSAFTYIGNDWIFVDLGYKQGISEKWYIQYNLSHMYTNINFNTQGKQHNGQDWLGEAALFGTLSDKLNLVFGGTYEKKVIPVNSTLPQMDQNNLSSYIQVSYAPVNFLKATAGVQYNQPYRGYPGVVPIVGIVSNINDNLGLKLIYGQAFRSPCPMEQYISAPPALTGNPSLDPETITTSEAQVFYNKKTFQSNLTFFTSKYNNTIIRTATIPATYTNGGGIKVDGVELEGKASLRHNVNILGSYSYEQNKSDSNIDDYMQISNHMVKVGVIYDLKSNISFGLFNQYYSKPADVVNVFPTRKLYNPVPDAYNWVTLNVTYKASDRLEFSVYGTNLLDQTVFYPEFGRKRINSLPGEPGAAGYFKVSLTL